MTPFSASMICQGLSNVLYFIFAVFTETPFAKFYFHPFTYDKPELRRGKWLSQGHTMTVGRMMSIFKVDTWYLRQRKRKEGRKGENREERKLMKAMEN